jgi:hypothetical protein
MGVQVPSDTLNPITALSGHARSLLALSLRRVGRCVSALLMRILVWRARSAVVADTDLNGDVVLAAESPLVPDRR